MFGNPETTTGGNALKFYASIRMDIRRIAAIKEGQNVIGNRTKVKVVKNKVAPPFKEVEFDILYNEGISKAGDLIDLAVNHNIVKKSGAWFSFGDDRFQGREQFRQIMLEKEELFNGIEKEVRKAIEMPIASEAESNSANGEEKNKKKK